MPAVQVRDFSPEIYEQIKQEAKASGRSIMQQTKHIVLQHFAQPNATNAEAPPIRSFARIEAQNALSMHAPTSAQNPFFNSESQAVEQRATRRNAVFSRIAERSYPAAIHSLDSEALIRSIRDER